MENKHYLYYHFNPITKKLFYVGVGYKNRAYTFKWGRSKHYCNYIKKHGDPIVIIRYQNLEVDYAYELEERLIKKFGRVGIEPNGILINKSSGGKTSGNGVKQIRNPEWNSNISKAKKGKPQHNELGKKAIGNKNSKPVNQYDLNGVFIKEWKSQLEASKCLNINYQSINNCVMGLSKSAGNYIWKLKTNKK
jgi:hypothetical protein